MVYKAHAHVQYFMKMEMSGCSDKFGCVLSHSVRIIFWLFILMSDKLIIGYNELYWHWQTTLIVESGLYSICFITFFCLRFGCYIMISLCQTGDNIGWKIEEDNNNGKNSKHTQNQRRDRKRKKAKLCYFTNIFWQVLIDNWFYFVIVKKSLQIW